MRFHHRVDVVSRRVNSGWPCGGMWPAGMVVPGMGGHGVGYPGGGMGGSLGHGVGMGHGAMGYGVEKGQNWQNWQKRCTP